LRKKKAGCPSLIRLSQILARLGRLYGAVIERSNRSEPVGEWYARSQRLRSICGAF
jgi:hypothetical protein